MTDDELKAMRARADAAPEGPWRTYPNPMRSDGVFVGQDRPQTAYPGVTDGDGKPIMTAVPEGAALFPCQVPHALGEFIAHAREDVPKLLDEVERLMQGIASMEPWVDAHCGYVCYFCQAEKSFDTNQEVYVEQSHAADCLWHNAKFPK